MSSKKPGRVHSIQSMGTLDGPGVRFVVFLQGCNLRCKCCHNPDTWDMSGGKEYTPLELAEKAERYKTYFGEKGGITLSGGEPLLQADFALELFEICHSKGINTCLDTSGSLLNDSVKTLLRETDRVLLDIKYTKASLYLENVGCSLAKPMEFLSYLNGINIPTTLRQVIIPGFNDNEDNILALNKIISDFSCIDKVELLPFRKICQIKYDKMNLKFPFENVPEPSGVLMERLNKILKTVE